ncbi:MULTISPECIES: OmpA family protein [unclassified Imperialibacter]|uniref:OmpA family protein n=1 Tax=unclassified Imperialibacter TaxID=2629706 RepID=UPI001251B19D|nr:MULTISPECIES: OmpA family protein [unclassified Imperialibacter]CAD5277266.1 putative WD40-like Beta Propeller Repeat [Imperialibacter sp. 89]CAD5291943.1 putative WD40-like Beta Propeller Repeat [Imperialibacter sp. 75]VVT02503.1 putative WD40-like Beta Propeller Repeat [Imperialibacter sp. EC-SDR9]
MKFFWSALLLAFSLHVSGQSVEKLKKVADEYYDAERYLEAAEFYEKVISLSPSDLESRYRQAFSYLKSTNYNTAEEKFSALSLVSGPHQPSSIYYHGFLTKIKGDFKAADSIFSTFLQLEPASQQKLLSLVKFQKAGCELGMRLQRAKPKYKLTSLTDVNSDQNDLGVIEWAVNGNLVMSTTRKVHSLQYYDPKFGDYLPSLISYGKANNDKWKETSFFKKLNTRWSQGTGSFTADGRTFYYSDCNKESTCKVLVTTWDGKNWTAPAELDTTINMPGTDVKHPFVTASADTIFFSSNRPGGQGGLDIWMSLRIDSSRWTTAINLGERINTQGDEITPFYSPAYSCLTFASNGLAGYGGFDLYLAKQLSFFEPKVYNLGVPFNSTLDDTYLFLGKSGYLSSNRDGKELDVMTFPYGSLKEFFEYIMTNDAIIDFQYYTASSLDLYTFRMDDYQGYDIFFPTGRDSAPPTFNTTTELINIHGAGVTPGELVRLTIDSRTDILTLANQSGRFAYLLSPDSISNKYTITTTSKQRAVVNEVDTAGSFYEYAYEKVYFNYGSSHLRSETFVALDDLVRQFEESNIALIDIQTHADSRGDKDYNRTLSEKRGVSIMKYLLSKGIPEAKMRVFAFGEEEPISENDSWYARFFNRRAQIIIHTETQVIYNKPETFLVMRSLDLKSVAQNLGIASNKLKEWNGIDNRDLAEGHTLRVFDAEHRTPSMRNLINQKDIDDNFFLYTVKPGESLESIARKFKTIEELIYEINQLEEDLKPGDEIIVML